MNNERERFTDEEQQLIDFLRSASQPKLSPRVSDAIHELILAEVDAMPSVRSARSSGLRVSRQLLLGMAAACLVMIILFIFTSNQQGIDPDNLLPGTQIVQQNSPTMTATTNGSTVEATPTAEAVVIEPSVAASVTAVIETDTLPSATVYIETATPTVIPLLPTFTPTLETVIAVEGQIQNIQENRFTINGIEIEVSAEHPVLRLIEVGDTLRIQGIEDEEGTVIASVIDNISDVTVADATVALEGAVEALEDNLVIVNDIPVYFSADDPILTTLKIGDFLSIKGNFATIEGQILLSVVYVTILEDTGTNPPANCWYHDTAMGMGHWHCDGMGMGMGGMGMGMGGMGMGQ